MDCAKLSKSLVLATCDGSTAGIEPKIILINFDDWKHAETKEIEGNVLSALVLKTGAYGFRYESEKNSLEKDCTLAKGTYRNQFDHKVVGRVFVRSQEIKDELIKLSKTKVVIIVENLDAKNPETKYELYGADNGLEMTEFNAPSTDTDGVLYNFTLASGDNAKESSLPLSVYTESEKATDTLINGLVQGAEE